MYDQISMGVLSYNSPKTLANTLSSYKQSELTNKIDDIFCILQYSERQQEEVKVCEQFNIKSIKMPDNKMIASGFKEIFFRAKNEFVLFLENDFCTYCTPQDVDYYLDSSLYFLSSGQADLVRARSRRNPGFPNYAKIHLKHTSPHILIHSQHLSECMYWLEHPETVYPTKITKVSSRRNQRSWYLSSSRSCNYTNNPYICKKEFFERAIFPYLEDGSNIESVLTPIWSQQNYNCIFGFGIFTHDRKNADVTQLVE